VAWIRSLPTYTCVICAIVLSSQCWPTKLACVLFAWVVWVSYSNAYLDLLIAGMEVILWSTWSWVDLAACNLPVYGLLFPFDYRFMLDVAEHLNATWGLIVGQSIISWGVRFLSAVLLLACKGTVHLMWGCSWVFARWTKPVLAIYVLVSGSSRADSLFWGLTILYCHDQVSCVFTLFCCSSWLCELSSLWFMLRVYYYPSCHVGVTIFWQFLWARVIKKNLHTKWMSLDKCCKSNTELFL